MCQETWELNIAETRIISSATKAKLGGPGRQCGGTPILSEMEGSGGVEDSPRLSSPECRRTWKTGPSRDFGLRPAEAAPTSADEILRGLATSLSAFVG